MSLILDLPAELESELAAEATQFGLPLSEYVVRMLTTGMPCPMPRNGSELVEYWQKQGVIGTRPDITDSQKHARSLREQAQTRDRE